MSDRDPKTRPAEVPAPRDAPAGSAPHTSGRVQFDERGQAIWAWAVKTGMFDRNASTQRIRALVETPIELQVDEGPLPRATPVDGGARAPADAKSSVRTPAGAPPRAAPTTPVRPGLAESAGRSEGNPYDRAAPRANAAASRVTAPTPRPGESTGFDPYSRGPAKRPEATSYNPYERVPKKP